MHSDHKLATSEPGSVGLAVPKSASRRRLLRAGVGAAPAVLTIVSMPVRAATTVQGRSASAMASMNAGAKSGNSLVTVSSAGDSAATWVGCHPSSPWPTDCVQGQPKHSFPACLGAAGSSYKAGGASLKDALKDSSMNGLPQYLAAAYLNFRSGKSPVVTEPQLLAIWNACYLNGPGYWSPVSGAKWDWAKTKLWMEQNGVVGV
jgi:hypothetical protein